MLDGATATERKKWQLKDKSQYHYLDQSSVLELDSVDEKEEFLLLTSGMQSVGIGRYSRPSPRLIIVAVSSRTWSSGCSVGFSP
jgi:myosin heavy subunit